MAGDRKKLFYLREYDEAFLKVFSRVIHLRAEEAYPLLKEIPTEPRPAIHTSQVTLPRRYRGLGRSAQRGIHGPKSRGRSLLRAFDRNRLRAVICFRERQLTNGDSSLKTTTRTGVRLKRRWNHGAPVFRFSERDHVLGAERRAATALRSRSTGTIIQTSPCRETGPFCTRSSVRCRRREPRRLTIRHHARGVVTR